MGVKTARCGGGRDTAAQKRCAVSGGVWGGCLHKSDRTSGRRTHIVIMGGIIHAGPVPQVGRDRHLWHLAISDMTTQHVHMELMPQYIDRRAPLQLRKRCTKHAQKRALALRRWKRKLLRHIGDVHACAAVKESTPISAHRKKHVHAPVEAFRSPLPPATPASASCGRRRRRPGPPPARARRRAAHLHSNDAST